MATSERLFRLLGLLQSRRSYTGDELAERLDVTARTVRKDVERLRELGYVVEATPGAGGGYWLRAGRAVPPLVLDNDEAAAVVVGLRAAAGSGVSGMAEVSVRTLVKLMQVVPARVRDQVEAVQAHTDSVSTTSASASIDALLAAANACREQREITFDYIEAGDRPAARRVEPYRIILVKGRWHLVTWDLDEDAWRLVLVDRVRSSLRPHRRFAPRPAPVGGFDEYARTTAASETWGYRARVVIHAPLATVAQRLPVDAGTLTPLDHHTCLLDAGSDNAWMLLHYIGLLDIDFSVGDDPELVAAAAKLADRYARSLRAPGPAPGPEPDGA